MLRTGDLTGHDVGSDAFAIVMTAPSREARAPSPMDIRAVLERIGAAISLRNRIARRKRLDAARSRNE